MNKKEIGHTGEYVFPLGLGTYNIRNPKKAIDSFVYAIENGVELILISLILPPRYFIKGF